MQSAIQAFYWQGLLVLPAPIVLDDIEIIPQLNVTAMSSTRAAIYAAGLEPNFRAAGFDVNTMSCRLWPYAANGADDFEPEVHVTNATGFNFTGKAMVDFQCTKPENDTRYWQVFTMVTNRGRLMAKVNVSTGLVVRIRNLDLNFTIEKI